ncbi:hypothetical protein BDZ45DRAFT_510581 [Acephala macrosclerotiorum]|nr:hypothetical protein BDZ45DRAFT_510581 [Acephala macrosclerotiorum]
MYGKRLLLIRNPHGRGEWTGAWSDGSKEWTPEWMLRLDHRFGNDGYFWMSFEDFLERYKEFDRTRLFSDEWNIAQKWTCLDLPYTSEYHKVKFSFTLSKAAPVVISLSEPAKRYFRGLWGPYAVSCSYRLEKVGQGLVIDVGGPLKTARSTSAELNLEAGEYHVLIKTHSYPDDRWPSLESVIRQNVDERPQKLRQVGLRYDQAHSRARLEDEAYEKELAKKARQARKANLVKRLRAKMLTEKRRKKHQENKKRRKLLAAKLKKRAKAKAKLEKDVPATDAAWMGEIDSSKTISKVLKRTTRSATKMSKTENLVVKGESISETVSQATPNVAVEVTTKSGDATVISDIDDDSDINSDVSDISTDEVEEMIEEMRKDAYGKKLFPLEPPKPAALGLLPKDGSVILDWNASVTLGLRVYAQNSEIEMRIIRPEWEDVLGSSEDDRSDGDAIIQHIAREEKKDKSKFESENEKLLEMISY